MRERELELSDVMKCLSDEALSLLSDYDRLNSVLAVRVDELEGNLKEANGFIREMTDDQISLDSRIEELEQDLKEAQVALKGSQDYISVLSKLKDEYEDRVERECHQNLGLLNELVQERKLRKQAEGKDGKADAEDSGT